jgi:hypothetical protein
MPSGGCLCGAVRYEIDGAAEFSVLCYCRDCQRASGTGHVPVMGARRAQLRITGTTASYAVRADSGQRAIRHFCRICGSLLFGSSGDAHDPVMSIYVGTLDDLSAFRPTTAICTRSRASWDRVVGDLKEFHGMPATTAPQEQPLRGNP